MKRSTASGAWRESGNCSVTVTGGGSSLLAIGATPNAVTAPSAPTSAVAIAICLNRFCLFIVLEGSSGSGRSARIPGLRKV